MNKNTFKVYVTILLLLQMPEHNSPSFWQKFCKFFTKRKSYNEEVSSPLWLVRVCDSSQIRANIKPIPGEENSNKAVSGKNSILEEYLYRVHCLYSVPSCAQWQQKHNRWLIYKDVKNAYREIFSPSQQTISNKNQLNTQNEQDKTKSNPPETQPVKSILKPPTEPNNHCAQLYERANFTLLQAARYEKIRNYIRVPQSSDEARNAITNELLNFTVDGKAQINLLKKLETNQSVTFTPTTNFNKKDTRSKVRRIKKTNNEHKA